MAKEVLLYGTIDAYSSSDYIKEFNEVTEENEDITVRVNTPGGSPEYGFGLVSKFSEYTGSKKVKVDGKAFSMGLFFCVYAAKENVEALDVSEFLLHRAAYPEWVERDCEFFTDAMRANLERVNKSLRTAFENRVDVALFEQLTNCKIKDVFSMDSRIDVFFNAQVAKKVGLISKINAITPQKAAEVNSLLSAMSKTTYEMAALTVDVPKTVEEQTIISQNSNQDKMTLEELKAKHPEAFKEAVNLGVKTERDRVGSIMVFNHLDPAACKKAIESGEFLTETQKSEFLLKANSPEALLKLQKEAAKPAVTTAEEIEKDAEEKEVESFLTKVDQALKRK